MKTRASKEPRRWRIFSRRSATVHNRWLLLNLQTFNFAGGWNQIVARTQAEQFSS